ncbi:hypothetical protein J2TS6_42630 [Paenibacillus albilobatus]|uniref:Uncharacterized protein n=1 Tax=Paenibacillus albilobatus TaxID=2716884 RepID=A0A919XHU3_9BACL|nr:hypothetical protein [Paenibacillus albilobatus]GIO33122.1 hypothetical protein J2TS6_42630 [Paenibacillus albilobatus]
MTAPSLLFALKDFIGEKTKNMQLGDGDRPPAVHLGWLPNAGQPEVINGKLIPPRASDSDFPYIIIRALDGEDGEDYGSVKIRILVGTKSADDEGYLDILHLIEVLRNSLLSTAVIGQRFEIKRPLKWTLYEDQPYPEWIGEIMTTWTVPTVLREVEGL